MSLFNTAISNLRPETNRRQIMSKWLGLIATDLRGAISLPALALATPLVDSTPNATVADGIIAIREGKFRDAVAIWTPHAEAGNPSSDYGLGPIYSRDRGAGMQARLELSHRRYKAAAHKGHVDSVFELAFHYEPSMRAASAPRPTQTMRWPFTVSLPLGIISMRSKIWQYCCHKAAI